MGVIYKKLYGIKGSHVEKLPNSSLPFWLTRQAHQTAGRRVIIDCQESWQVFDLVTILKKVDEQS